MKNLISYWENGTERKKKSIILALKGAPDKFKVIKEKWVVQGKLLIFSGGFEIHLSLVALPDGFAGISWCSPFSALVYTPDPEFAQHQDLHRNWSSVVWRMECSSPKGQGIVPTYWQDVPKPHELPWVSSFAGIQRQAGTLCGQEHTHVVVWSWSQNLQ